MTPEERAREIADRLCDVLTPVAHGGFDVNDDDWLPIIAAAIREAEAAVWSRMRDTVEATAREARIEALEEAAKVALDEAGWPETGSPNTDLVNEGRNASAMLIAAQIRALKHKPE